ncbi:DNA polymerase I [Spirulina subsalsa]|uniref:DNA polymerase I n=1 Tax=Spirulina subsalsa TaxID=54311 RepID=UPI00047510E4|nr:DNA polymerase I [Spirulina subsalsa]
MTVQTRPTLLLIDGHSLAFRAYYAFAKGRDGGLRTSGGIPTNICFGFVKSLLQILTIQKPDRIAIAFDLADPTFRHKLDEGYKADRTDTPEDFIQDLANLKTLLNALNLPTVTASGYEADDILGTLTQQGTAAGYQVKIISGDRDLFQLVDDEKGVSVLYFDRNVIKGSVTGTVEYKSAEVEAKLGVKPSQVVDYKALCGDKSDSIPGVKGIGEKTAVKLLHTYETLDNIYQNLGKITGANYKKLKEGKADAEHSQILARIKLDVPLDITLDQCHLRGFNPQNVKPILEHLELRQFLKQIDHLQHQLGGEVPPPPPESTLEDTSFFSPEETDSHPPRQSITIQPQIIQTEAQLTQLITQLKQHTDPNLPVAWDTETTSLNPRQTELVGLGCCWGKNPQDVAYIPLSHTQGEQLEKALVLEQIGAILADRTYPKVFQNAKFDRLVLHHQGIALDGVVFDPMLAHYVLHPEENHNLTDLSNQYLDGITAQSYKELGLSKEQTIADLPIPQAAAYCGLDAYATYQLVPKLQAELDELPELNQLFRDIELPLEPVLAAMETRGIRINLPYLKTLSEQLEQELQQLEQQAYEDVGETFNLNSPKQLAEILFDKLGLSTKKSRKTKTGYSTDHATLEKLQGDHPLIDHILSHRTLAKLKSTYIDALPELIDPQTQRIHTDFNQAVTSTGRLSSSNPNLQNIPVRSEFSRQIRQAFLPQDGWLLASADYSQIELRILAHLSQEPVLVEAYQKGEDVHTVTARLLFEKSDVTPDERRLGKTINFGVIYGMGAQRFAREAGVSQKEGKVFIERYRSRYPRVFDYLETMKKNAIALGYVETLQKRRRYFNFTSATLQRLYESNPQAIDLDELKGLSGVDAQLLRAAANAPIQGSSADIIKIAMVKLQPILQQYQAKLLLQVHDELVFEVPPEEWESLEPQIKQIMEKAVSLTVPLEVEVRAGANWMEAK